MLNYIEALAQDLHEHADPLNAAGQKAYMRNQFEFYGLNASRRRAVQRPYFLKSNLPPKEELPALLTILWEKPQREFQLIGQELCAKYLKQKCIGDIHLYEFMVTHKSWWDTVDYIAANLMGSYFKNYPEERLPCVDKWLQSENIWLQRSALLFQLKYKEKLDTKLLTYTIDRLLGSKEFFINKAIGWILREYGKTDPSWVLSFATSTNLHNLSKREALRIIKSSKNETGNR